jgi:hypothetical protein
MGKLFNSFWINPTHPVQETSIATTQRGEGGMAMEAEEEGRKGIPCLLSSREENIASNITEVMQSSPLLSRSVDICFQSSPLLSRSVDICFLVKADVDVCGFPSYFQ